MKNGKIELEIGSLFRVAGTDMKINDVQNGSVIVTDLKTKKRYVHGLENFKRILRQIGYEFEEDSHD